jgi:cytochrome c553
MRRALALVGFAICAGAAHPAAAAEEATAQSDPAKGQKIAAQVCAACHAADGNSTIPANPKLAGQFPEYLQDQLVDFKPAGGKKAERENPVMGGMAAGLSAEDMRNVAAYFGSQQPKPGVSRNKDTVELGRRIWRGGDASKGLPACASCHGAAGAGVPVRYPRLAGQHAEYIEAQLKAFAAGTRANDANKVMRTIAGKMSEAEVRAVADYAAGLR